MHMLAHRIEWKAEMFRGVIILIRGVCQVIEGGEKTFRASSQHALVASSWSRVRSAIEMKVRS